MTIPNAENGVFDFRVTDSRGYSTNLTVQKTVIPYVKLTCHLSDNKPDTEGNMKLCIRGNYFDGDFGAASNKLTVQYRYKVSGTPWTDAQQWKTITPAISNHTYVAEDDLTGLDYQTAYTFQAKAVDKLETVESVEYTARATPVFDWGERDFAIHGNLQVDGNVSISGIPVLNTSHVQTYYWQTSGGVSLDSVAEFLATCTRDCGFIVVIQGREFPFMGMAVGAVYGSGKYGAVTLYDCLHGVQSRRVYDGVFYET